MRYVVFGYSDEAAWEAQTPAEVEASLAEIFAWVDHWEAEGKYVRGGAGLARSDTARTVRADGAGRPVVTDGPYIEAKEAIGGIIYLEANDIDEAVAIAATWPTFVHMGGAMEVRAVEFT